MSEKRALPLRIRLGFGIGDLGGNLFFTIMGFYLLIYLTDTVNLAAGLAGTALMIGKIWDAVTDPAVGYWSDHVRAPMGRRRPFILVGSILLFFAMILMFSVPSLRSQALLFLLATVLLCFLNTAYTLVNIPYQSLLPELTEDFHERTVLTGYRMSFAVLGTFVGAGAVLPIVNAFGESDLGWSVMGGAMGAVMLATALVTFFSIREPVHSEIRERKSFFRSYKEALRSKVFLLATIPWMLHVAGVSVVQGALLYYFRYVVEREALFQFALLGLLTTSLFFIPFWVRVSKKRGKRFAYNVGMAWMSVAVFLFFLFGHVSSPWFSVILMAVAGFGFSTHYVMPHSILPDAVECDYADSGVRREGVFYSLFTFGSKVAQALALGINGWVLSIAGYVAEQPQTEAANFAIRVLCGPVPMLFFAAGIAVLSFYPVTREYYEKVLAKIHARELRLEEGS
jgi:GPH family glycoside/pentoside/hexuronide:cation symporter